MYLQIGTQLPVPLFQQDNSSIFGCTPSVECDPQYGTLAAGVVSIYAVDPTSRTVGLCSGHQLSQSILILAPLPPAIIPNLLTTFKAVILNHCLPGNIDNSFCVLQDLLSTHQGVTDTCSQQITASEVRDKDQYLAPCDH